MDLYDVMAKRKSIRKFLPQKVSKEILLKILDAARVAPSWKNMQCWRFLAIDDKEIIKKVKANCDEWNQKFISDNIPMLIILLAVEADSGFREDKAYYLFDAGIAMEHLMLAAAAEGLGTCCMGLFDEKKLKNTLGIPDGIRVLAITPLGYPDQDPKPRPRKEISEIAYYNDWGNSLS